MGPFEITRHGFTQTILDVLEDHFGEGASEVFSGSPMLGCLNSKTRAAGRGSKARGSFADYYALYVVAEDCIKKGFLDGTADAPYAEYEGARFSDLFRRQRQLSGKRKLCFRFPNADTLDGIAQSFHRLQWREK